MKKFIALFMTVSLCALMLISCGEKPVEPDYTKTPDTTGRPPIEESTLGWDYEKIDLSGKKYVPSSADADESAVRFGRKAGTYEYEYFRALSGISLQAMVADSYVRYPNDAEDGFVTTYLNTVGIEEYTAPYESILYHAVTLLSDCDFAFPVSTFELVNGYWSSVSYELCSEEKHTTLGLSFNGFDEKLTEYANILLALSEKYPDYKGEFVLSETAREAAEALVGACKPVVEKRDALRESWRAYYHANAPTMEVMEEFDAEHNAVKITLFGNATGYIADLHGRYIKDYRYEKTLGSGGTGTAIMPLPMEAPVEIYLPVFYYMNIAGVQSVSFDVSKVNEKGRYFSETVSLTLNPAQYYSDEAITMTNLFLDAALQKFFAGTYSERDLLSICGMDIQYVLTDRSGAPIVPVITFRYLDGNGEMQSSSYEYTEFFDGDELPGEVPAGLEQDLKHFHGLTGLFVGQEKSQYKYSDGLLESLLPYYVTDLNAHEHSHS